MEVLSLVTEKSTFLIFVHYFISPLLRAWGKCWASLFCVTSVPKLPPDPVRISLTLDLALMFLHGEMLWVLHFRATALCVGVHGLVTCENHLFVPEVMVKTSTRMGLNFPSDKWHLRNRTLKYPLCFLLTKGCPGKLWKTRGFEISLLVCQAICVRNSVLLNKNAISTGRVEKDIAR